MLGGDKVAEATRDRVLSAMAELDFVVNGHARALGGRGTPIIALVVNEIFGPSFSVLARGVEGVATKRSHLFVMSTTHDSAEREAEVTSLLRQQRPAAVLWLGPLEDDPVQEQRWPSSPAPSISWALGCTSVPARRWEGRRRSAASSTTTSAVAAR
jgi:DNA-binding LacI/PurR family transcriptional regulator